MELAASLVLPRVPSPSGFYVPMPPSDHVMDTVSFYFAHLIPVKLTMDNYLKWRAQVLLLLRNPYLESYINGTLPFPPPYHPAYMLGWPGIKPSSLLSSPLSRRESCHWSSLLLCLGMRGRPFILVSLRSPRRVPMLFALRLER